ncbi:MAG: hypothetical protein WCF67_12920 [Chitinophagaceae bacterium]
MFRYILLVIGLVILYKLIFDVIIPVYRASRDIRKRFRDINQQMGDRMNQANQSQAADLNRSPVDKPSKKDYIDFEEVK